VSKSRRTKHKAKRKRQKAAALLGDLAGVLNACEKAGIRIRHPTVAVLTDYGAVIAFKKGWEVRPFAGDGRPVDGLDD